MPYPSYSTTDGLVSLSSPDDRVLTDLSLHWPSLQRDEAKAKDRVISHLESELRIETGRAQQFRDLLEKNLATSLNRSVPSLLFFLAFHPFFFPLILHCVFFCVSLDLVHPIRVNDSFILPTFFFFFQRSTP